MSDLELSESEQYIRSRDAKLAQRAGLTGAQMEEFELSDEEVMGISESETDQEAYYAKDGDDEGEGRGGDTWGPSRDQYYGGGSDEDDESGQEDEEAEARRLQQQRTARLSEADFIEEEDAEGWKKQAEQDMGVVEELPPTNFEALSKEERKAFIQESFPEVLLLAEELKACNAAAKELETEQIEDEAAQTILEVKQTALNSYRGMLCAYFALLSDRDLEGAGELKTHPVMEGILKARELWRVAQLASSAAPVDDSEDLSSDEEADALMAANDSAEAEKIELDESSEHSSAPSDTEPSDLESASEEESEMDSDSDEFNVDLTSAAKSLKARRKLDDYDEAADSVEQQARLKSKQGLRFYTSQIGKKYAVKEDKFAGDLDLPYQERAYERRQRLLEAAKLRGLQEPDRLGDSQDEDGQEEHLGAGNEFYEAAAAAKAMKKSARRQAHEDAKQAAKQGKLQEYMAENPSVDKRAINFQIRKNKGLTPKRRKENRNSRVKKRVRYEDAQKRLKGARRVYETPSGPYQGEKSGISKRVVHSQKF